MQLKSLPKEIIILSKLYYQDNKNITAISKETNIQYNYTFLIVKRLQGFKYIEKIKTKAKRSVYIKLTDKGKLMGKICNELVNSLEQDDNS